MNLICCMFVLICYFLLHKQTMEAKTLILNFLFGFFFGSICPGCGSTYKTIDPDLVPIDDYWNEPGGGGVQIAMDYDVLTQPGARKYAKMEKKNMVSLVLVSIQNSGLQELNLMQNFVFLTSQGDSIVPLTLEAAMGSFIEPVTDKESTGMVELDVPQSWEMISGAGLLFKESKVVVSHIRFANDMIEYYLENRVLAPGLHMKGFLALPVWKGTPLTISLR